MAEIDFIEYPIFKHNLYSSGSHKKCLITCELNCSKKCKITYLREYKDILKTKEINDKYICLYCSRTTKFMGSDNPNSKYDYDRDFMKEINTNEKSYLLGWIASDGHIRNSGITIQINKKDIDILYILRDIICKTKEIPITIKEEFCSLGIHSKEIANDVANHLGICFGKKSHDVKFPQLDNDTLKWSFIRGVFDGDGSICEKKIKNYTYLRSNISTNSEDMRLKITEFCGIPCHNSKDQIQFSHYSTIDFLDKLYDNKTNLFLERKYNKYIELLQSKSSNFVIFKVIKKDKKAILPYKPRLSDAGLDISIIKLIKTVGDVGFYDTGLSFIPHPGYYLKIFPRSSISKTGYMLANSVGIIDSTYSGNLIIALRKVDKTSNNLDLPCRIAQVVAEKSIFTKIEEVGEEE